MCCYNWFSMVSFGWLFVMSKQAKLRIQAFPLGFQTIPRIELSHGYLSILIQTIQIPKFCSFTSFSFSDLSARIASLAKEFCILMTKTAIFLVTAIKSNLIDLLSQPRNSFRLCCRFSWRHMPCDFWTWALLSSVFPGKTPIRYTRQLNKLMVPSKACYQLANATLFWTRVVHLWTVSILLVDCLPTVLN